MSWVLKRSFFIVFSILLLIRCTDEYQELPPQVSFILSLERGNDQREKILADVVSDNNTRVAAWGNILRAQDKILENQFLESLPYLEQAEFLFREFEDDTEGLARALYFKAHVYWSLGAVSEGVLSFSQEAVSLVGDGRWATYLGNQSTYLLELGRYDEVLAISDTLLPIFKSNNSNLAEALAVRVTALNALDPDFDQRDSLVSIIVRDQRSISVPVDRKHVYERLLDLGVLQNADLSAALDFAIKNKYVILEAKVRDQLSYEDFPETSPDQVDSLRDAAFVRALNRSENTNQKFLQYELASSVRNVERKREQAAFRRQTYVFIFGAFLIGIVVVYVFFRNRNQIKQERLRAQDARLILESYKNKIRPHFLFNQLNNVSSFLSQDKVVDAQEYIGLLSVHLRSLLEADKSDNTRVALELDRLENFIALQRLSTFPDVEVRIHCMSNVSSQKIPSGLLQPLLENSYKYAANARQEGVYIEVRAQKEGNLLVLEVEDSGYGFLERTPGTGSGLSLIKERIDFNSKNSKTPSYWSMDIHFGKQKSIVKITMPFQHD